MEKVAGGFFRFTSSVSVILTKRHEMRGPVTSDVFHQQGGRAYLETQGIRDHATSVVLRMTPETPPKANRRKITPVRNSYIWRTGDKWPVDFCLCNSTDILILGDRKVEAWRLLPIRFPPRRRGVGHIWSRKSVAEIDTK